MSDYTPTTNFGAKDGLTPGTPAKKILGAEFDTEFDAIETAIATKYEAGSTILDTNSNESIKLISTTSAVNEITVANAATGNKPAITQTSSGAEDVGIDIEGVELHNGVITGALVGNATTSTNTTGNAATVTTNANLSGAVTSSGSNVTTLASGAVHQGHLSTAVQQVFTALGVSVDITLSGGAYHLLHGFVESGTGNGTIGAIAGTTYSYGVRLLMSPASSGYWTSRYIQASPPYDLGDGEIPLFIYALMDSNGDIAAVSTSPDPTWANNGPTNTRADVYDADGVGYQRKKVVQGTRGLSPRERSQALREARTELVPVTQAIKNADMNEYPHAFMGNIAQGLTPVMLDPVSDFVQDIVLLEQEGEDIMTILNSDYVKIGNTHINRKGPNGLLIPDVRWK